MTRRLVWFSAGAASAVATALTLADNFADDVHIAYIDTGSEHPDNARFRADCEAWDFRSLVNQAVASALDATAKRKGGKPWA